MEIFAPKFSGEAVLPWQPLNIMPIGDIQYNGPEGIADMDRLARHIKWGVEHDVYFVGMGDYIDFLSPSNRARLRSSDLYDTADKVIDDSANRLEKDVMEVLRPSVGRWLGLVEGHHYYLHSDGESTGQHLASFLKTYYSGDAGLFRIVFRDKVEGTAISKHFIHHGHGTASTLGGATARADRFLGRTSAQVIWLGHHHQINVIKIHSLDITDRGAPYLFHQTRAVVLTGSFMRGWMQGHEIGGRPQGTYVEKAMMPPVVLGGPMVTLTPKRVRVKGNSLRLVDIKGSV